MANNATPPAGAHLTALVRQLQHVRRSEKVERPLAVQELAALVALVKFRAGKNLLSTAGKCMYGFDGWTYKQCTDADVRYFIDRVLAALGVAPPRGAVATKLFIETLLVTDFYQKFELDIPYGKAFTRTLDGNAHAMAFADGVLCFAADGFVFYRRGSGVQLPAGVCVSEGVDGHTFPLQWLRGACADGGLLLSDPARVPYAPQRLLTWDAVSSPGNNAAYEYVKELLPDDVHADALLRGLALSLYGAGSTLKALYVLYGPGHSGKSGLVSLLRLVFGTRYCRNLDSTWMERDFTGDNTRPLNFRARLLVDSDFTGKTFGEHLKKLTGGADLANAQGLSVNRATEELPVHCVMLVCSNKLMPLSCSVLEERIKAVPFLRLFGREGDAATATADQLKLRHAACLPDMFALLLTRLYTLKHLDYQDVTAAWTYERALAYRNADEAGGSGDADQAAPVSLSDVERSQDWEKALVAYVNRRFHDVGKIGAPKHDAQALVDDFNAARRVCNLPFATVQWKKPLTDVFGKAALFDTRPRQDGAPRARRWFLVAFPGPAPLYADVVDDADGGPDQPEPSEDEHGGGAAGAAALSFDGDVEIVLKTDESTRTRYYEILAPHYNGAALYRPIATWYDPRGVALPQPPPPLAELDADADQAYASWCAEVEAAIAAHHGVSFAWQGRRGR